MILSKDVVGHEMLSFGGWATLLSSIGGLCGGLNPPHPFFLSVPGSSLISVMAVLGVGWGVPGLGVTPPTCSAGPSDTAAPGGDCGFPHQASYWGPLQVRDIGDWMWCVGVAELLLPGAQDDFIVGIWRSMRVTDTTV